jgi:hypothetical protein
MRPNKRGGHQLSCTHNKENITANQLLAIRSSENHGHGGGSLLRSLDYLLVIPVAGPEGPGWSSRGLPAGRRLLPFDLVTGAGGRTGSHPVPLVLALFASTPFLLETRKNCYVTTIPLDPGHCALLAALAQMWRLSSVFLESNAVMCLCTSTSLLIHIPICTQQFSSRW